METSEAVAEVAKAAAGSVAMVAELEQAELAVAAARRRVDPRARTMLRLMVRVSARTPAMRRAMTQRRRTLPSIVQPKQTRSLWIQVFLA